MMRMMQLRSLGIDSFVMPYNKQDYYYRVFARWVNFKVIFESIP